MKFNKIAVLTASVLLSSSAFANADKDLIKPETKVTKHVVQKADFGAYKIERNLVYIPKSVASINNLIATKGNMAIVKSDTTIV